MSLIWFRLSYAMECCRAPKKTMSRLNYSKRSNAERYSNFLEVGRCVLMFMFSFEVSKYRFSTVFVMLEDMLWWKVSTFVCDEF